MKEPRLYFDHILEAIARIEGYTQSGREAFMVSRMAQDAVSRNFEIIGEATKRLPWSIRERYPDIPWSALAGLRDGLIHDYDQIDLNEMWLTVERDLPVLKPGLEKILADLDAMEDDRPEPE